MPVPITAPAHMLPDLKPEADRLRMRQALPKPPPPKIVLMARFEAILRNLAAARRPKTLLAQRRLELSVLNALAISMVLGMLLFGLLNARP